ncbi:PAS domain S-box protein [Anabaena sp. CA = ATCC 33047]|uniref:PAS domain S-box protein n=1 Tax=Anabaena sp. (strain CA / ATCC 33047) TaxID=52271 RepID=UPI00082A045F|nr:PAS domain S-box protein [Anabaena sp. CA = ATCC 33047]
MRTYQRALPYLIAVVATAIALLLSLWLESILHQGIGAVFYIAIIISTWYGGLRPGIVTIVLSTLAINYFLIPPKNQLWLTQIPDILRLGLFLSVALTINLITSNLLNSKRKIQQLTEKLIQENAEQLRMALSAAKMGIWDWNLVTGHIKWSPEHEQLFGLTAGSFDGRYETFDTCLHPDDREILNQAVQQALLTHSIYQCEFRVIWADGSIHWIEGRGQAFYSTEGQPVRMTGTVMAIDERKQAQGLLQQQVEQQRLVMEMTQHIRRSLNLQDILQTTVDEVRRFLGCDRVTIFQFSPTWGGTIIVESVAPEWMPILPLQIYDPCIGEEYVEPFKQGLVTAKADIYTAGISPCHVDFLASLQVRANLVVPIFQGNELWGLLAAHHCAAPREWQSSEIDLLRQLGAQVSIVIQQAALFAQLQTELTERKQAEAALQQQEITLRLFAQYAPASIAMFDKNMHYVMVSQRWVDDYQLNSAGSIIGRSHYEIFPELPERWRQIHQRCLAGAVDKCEEDSFIRPNGMQQWIRWEIHPWHTATGEIGGIIIFSEDITQRKQAEQSLAKELVRIQTLFNTSFDGIVILDEQGNVLDANPRFAQMLGYTPEEITRLNIYDWDAEFTTEELQQLMSDYIHFKSGVLETRHRRKDGSIYDVEISSSVVEWEGEILRFCVCRDISDRKQAQIALQQLNNELEQRVVERTAQLTEVNDRLIATLMEQHQASQQLAEQAQLLDLAHDTIITTELNGVICFWNKGAESMYGWNTAAALGQNTHTLLKTQFPKPLPEIEAELLEKGYWEGELIHFCRDAQPVTVASRWVLQTDNTGKPMKILEINNDITERKQAENALRQSEEKFRQLAENIHAVFWITDHQSQRILYVSKAYETIWKRSCESLYQNYSDWLDAIHPDERQNVEIAYSEQVKTGKYDIKYRIIRPDGSMRWIRDRAFPIKNELGEMVRIAGIAEDITELQQIEQMKSEFIGIVSHELRTPLTAIRAALGLLNSGIYDQKPEKFQRMIEIALIDSDRLVRLVNDILDLERLESGRAVLEKTTCNVADLIQQAVEGVQAIANQQHITFNINPTDAQVWAAADAIIQTLTNLLSNAIKFSPAHSTITLSVKSQQDCVLFQISDQGRGIPADKLELIFGRFQQVDASDSRSKGGTGLGLAICRSIIDQHGGKIWAKSKLGEGSTFFFTLPLRNRE